MQVALTMPPGREPGKAQLAGGTALPPRCGASGWLAANVKISEA